MGKRVKKEDKEKRKRKDPLHRSNSIAVFCCRFNILLCRIYFKCTMTTWHTNVRVRVIYIYREYIYILAGENENGARHELEKSRRSGYTAILRSP